MRLITFQDKYILDLFKIMEQNKVENPVYECKEIYYSKKEKELYDKFIKVMKINLKIPDDREIIPIWGWVIPKDKKIDMQYLDELFDRHQPNCGRVVAMELNVPKEFVLLSNFDVWKNHLFNCVFYDNYKFTDEDIKKLFVKVKGATLQASIPIIAKSFIVSIFDYNNYLERDYTDTEQEISDLQKNGKFLDG